MYLNTEMLIYKYNRQKYEESHAVLQHVIYIIARFLIQKLGLNIFYTIGSGTRYVNL